MSGSGDYTIRVWDLDLGECTAVCEGHTGTVFSISISEDGSKAVSGSKDKTVKVSLSMS